MGVLLEKIRTETFADRHHDNDDDDGGDNADHGEDHDDHDDDAHGRREGVLLEEIRAETFADRPDLAPLHCIALHAIALMH